MSELEDLFAGQLDEQGISYIRQVRCIAGRRYKFDFLLLAKRGAPGAGVPGSGVLIEIQGGGKTGAHFRWYGYQRDCDKANLAVAQGQAVLHFTAQDVRTRRAIEFITQRILGRPS